MGRFGSFDLPLEDRGVDLLFVLHVGGGCFSLMGLQVLASLCEGEVVMAALWFCICLAGIFPLIDCGLLRGRW